MGIIDLASMVLAPTAVKDGKVYNAIPNDQDFTFSRGTEATRINSARLIEKARTNFLLQSNSFDTTWGAGGGTLTSGQTGYDGSSDAWLFTMSSGANICNQTNTQSGVQTYSVYAKGSVNNGIRLYAFGSTNVNVYFNLNTGAVAAESNNIDASIEDVGSGWYRCSMTYNSTNTNIYLYLTNNSNSNAGSGSILIQDAQLEQGLVATDVITTTTSSVTVGITDDLPRVDYSGGGCPSLLLEPSRTNIIVQSEYIGSSWNPYGNISVTDNSATSPEGLQNATEISAAATTTAPIGIQDGFSVTANNDYTISFFAKKGDFRYIQLFHGGSQVTSNPCTNFDLEDGVVAYEETGVVSASIENYGNGWYRCIATMEALLTTLQAYITPVPTADAVRGASISATAGDNYYIYGIQLEEGSYPTSYIPTYGTSTSRSADSCSLSNASNLIGQTEGVLYAEVQLNVKPESGSPVVGILTTNNNVSDLQNCIILGVERNATGTNSIYCVVQVSNVTQAALFGSSITDGNYKIALAYKANDFALYVNGVQVATDTSGSVPTTSQVLIGTRRNSDNYTLADRVSEAILFPTRLTNDQLAELTK